MEGLGSLTLIVKAPNHRIEDQRVACDRTWTVKQLKEHLSSVHPEKPHKDQQKLVYFGKLLKDEASLQEVLTQDSYDDAHTVHLVCPSLAFDVAKPYIPRYTARHATQVTTQVNELRQRVASDPLREQQQSDSNSSAQPTPSVMSPEAMQQWYSNWAQMQSLHTQSLTTMTPQQKLWLQMYQQQWNMYNAAALQSQSSAQHLTQTPVEPAVLQQAPGAPAEPAPAAGRDEVVRMNAQGGVDAEGAQNDWLDTMYALVRFVMLLMLLYFYTTLGRFAIVIAVAVFFYLAQGNIFRLQRRRPAAQQAPQHPHQNEQNQAENQNNENNERYNIVNQNGENSEEANNNVVVVDENNSTWIDGVKLVITFIVTFFSSLIPQTPAAMRN